MATVEDVARGFQAGHFEPVRFVDQYQARWIGDGFLTVSEGTGELVISWLDRRRPLFARLQSDPNATYLAIEIKAIDDQIAECNRQIQEDRKKAKGSKI